MSSARYALFSMPLLAALGLSGCAWAPGGYIQERAESEALHDMVEMRPITRGLVRQELAETPEVPDLEQAREELQADVPHYDYRIGRGDVLSIIVYDHPELTIPAGSERSAAESGNTVHSDGTIFYPFVGRVEVEGLTVAEVRDVLAEELSSVINDPQVEVLVADYRSQQVHVTGEVREPGRQPVTNVPLTVLDAINDAGGLTEEANWHNVRLTRDGEEVPLSMYAMLSEGDLSENRVLRDGDVLHVPDTTDQKAYVLGEVGEPRSIPMGRGRVSLTDALTESGGFNEATADASGIFVIRQAAPDSDLLATVYQLDASDATALLLGTEFELEPMDIVYVTTTPLGRWNRVINELLPTVNAVYRASQATRDVRDLRDDF